MRTKRILVSPPVPDRDADPAELEFKNKMDAPHQLAPRPDSIAMPDHLKNNEVHIDLRTCNGLTNGHTEPQLHGSVDAYLARKVVPVSKLKQPTKLIGIISGYSEWISEILYIIRPLLYGECDWVSRLLDWVLLTTPQVILIKTPRPLVNPVAAALAIELIARALRRRCGSLYSLEKIEYARRDRDLLWYLFRGDIWKHFTR